MAIETHASTVGIACGPVIDQMANVVKLAVAAAFLLGLYLFIRGLVGLFRKGETPFLKRRGMFARIALGAFLGSLPAALQMSTVNAQLDHVEITRATEF